MAGMRKDALEGVADERLDRGMTLARVSPS